MRRTRSRCHFSKPTTTPDTREIDLRLLDYKTVIVLRLAVLCSRGTKINTYFSLALVRDGIGTHIYTTCVSSNT